MIQKWAKFVLKWDKLAEYKRKYDERKIDNNIEKNTLCDNI